MTTITHSRDHCGACGNCHKHCPCPNGPAETFDQALAIWASGVVNRDCPPDICGTLDAP